MEFKKQMRISMLLALAVVLSILESFIPFFNVIPGIRLGFANIIIIVVLYLYGFKDAITVSLLRVILIGILRTGLFSTTFFFSLAGAVVSILLMGLFKKTRLSIVGVSILGSIGHTIGQVLMAMFLLNASQFGYALPILLLCSIPTGIIIGICSQQIVIRFEKRL